MRSALIAGAVLVITLLTYFQFPGHTWLQQDSQIYVPILEHLNNPAVLRNEMLVVRPHVSFTLYDEIAIGLQRLTGLGFHPILAGQQIVTRALGVWGVYLMAASLGLGAGASLFIAAVLSLGATIVGPAVLTLEYEPTPRAFAVPLLLLAVGLVARGRDFAAGVAGSAAFLIHPPTVYPFWGVYFLLVLWPGKPDVMKRRLSGLAPLVAAAVVLLVASRYQAGVGETQAFFTRLDARQEELQRMRASYVYVSIWLRSVLGQYCALAAVTLLGYLRVRHRASLDLRFFLAGLPLAGVLSLPVSYLLLEQMRWALVPQLQPTRALLLFEFTALFLAAAAGVLAAARRSWPEAFAWFAVVYLAPANTWISRWPPGNRAAIVACVAIPAVMALWADAHRKRWAPAALAGVVVASFFAIPYFGKVSNYPRLHTPELASLIAWARSSTPPGSVFLFPDAGRDLDPGIFRAEARRAVYVDWKGGGQVNYLRELGEMWWQRWQKTMLAPVREPVMYGDLGVDYVVLRKPWPGTDPVYRNGRYNVFATAAGTRARL